MKAKGPTVVHFDMGPIPAWVFLAHDEEGFYSKLEDLGVPPMPFVMPGAAASTHIIQKDGGLVAMNTFIVCFNKPKQKSHAFVAVVAHEAVHVAEGCWASMGEEAPGEEIRAYAVQYLTQVFLDALWGSK